jgi:hypothetical protein
MDFSEIEMNVLLKNNSPLDDFLGLSPNDMYDLIYYPHENNSHVKIRSDIDNATLDKIPFFRIIEELLKIVHRESFIKLTPLGALPKKVVVELYSYKFIPEYFLENGVTKLTRQQDSISIENARLVAEVAGLVKKIKGKFSLTKDGILLLKPENRLKLFKNVLEAFTERFMWSYNDGYPEHPIGQKGWAFSVFMLAKFADRFRDGEFYGDKYVIAFPHFVDFFHNVTYETPKENCIRCYVVRTFDRFFEWFGLVTVEKGKTIYDKSDYKAADLLRKVFKIEES